jgi:hypothetical protein
VQLRDGTTGILRLVHVDNLAVYLERGALHAPNHAPADRLGWRATHDASIQGRRSTRVVPVPPGGVLLDYVPFYLGPRSPLLFRLATGRVRGYGEGQEPLVTLVASAEDVVAAGRRCVFTDGQALVGYTTFHDDLTRLADLDWATIHAEQWSRTEGDPDRQRRKQAEFLVHESLGWELVRGIAVCNDSARSRVQALLAGFPSDRTRHVAVAPRWYYEEGR